MCLYNIMCIRRTCEYARSTVLRKIFSPDYPRTCVHIGRDEAKFGLVVWVYRSLYTSTRRSHGTIFRGESNASVRALSSKKYSNGNQLHTLKNYRLALFPIFLFLCRSSSGKIKHWGGRRTYVDFTIPIVDDA